MDNKNNFETSFNEITCSDKKENTRGVENSTSKEDFTKKATLKEVLWIRDSRKETIWSDKKEMQEVSKVCQTKKRLQEKSR